LTAPRRATRSGADGFHRAGAGLRRAGGGAGQHRPGRGDGVDRIRLALPTAGLAIRPVDLDHRRALRGQVPGQAGAVGAGALHADLDQPTEAGQPGKQRRIAGRCGGELGVAEQPPGAVDRGRVVGAAVSVHAAEDIQLRARHDGIDVLVACTDETARTEAGRGGQDSDGCLSHRLL
jgi:hypothetical protein